MLRKCLKLDMKHTLFIISIASNVALVYSLIYGRVYNEILTPGNLSIPLPPLFPALYIFFILNSHIQVNKLFLFFIICFDPFPSPPSSIFHIK